MRIERSSQVWQSYSKPIDLSASKSFQQLLQTRSQDSQVSSISAQPSKTVEVLTAETALNVKDTFTTEETFSAEERRYGGVTVSSATHTKLKKLREINEQADYTGMSPEEIYETIWNRYNEAFDGNMIAITACIAGPAEWGPVNNQFIDEITEHIVNPAIRAAYDVGEGQTKTHEEIVTDAHHVAGDARRKLLGYYGKSYEEMEAEIKEKYAGKNTNLDFLKMQSELEQSGVLYHRMGYDNGRTYCYMLKHQFDIAFNPNSIYTVGHEKSDFMTADQWYRVADQPFDADRMATAMKDNLDRISGDNRYTEDIRQLFLDYIERFISQAMGYGIDRLISEMKE